MYTPMYNCIEYRTCLKLGYTPHWVAFLFGQIHRPRSKIIADDWKIETDCWSQRGCATLEPFTTYKW